MAEKNLVLNVTCMRKILEVEEIVDKLKRKHGSALSLERYNAWAHMIYTGQYSSYDDPPNYPYFRMPGSKVPESSSQVKSTQCQVMSPGKRIHHRGECIQQLDRWYDLLKKGAITNEQYENLKKSILGDIGDM